LLVGAAPVPAAAPPPTFSVPSVAAAVPRVGRIRVHDYEDGKPLGYVSRTVLPSGGEHFVTPTISSSLIVKIIPSDDGLAHAEIQNPETSKRWLVVHFIQSPIPNTNFGGFADASSIHPGATTTFKIEGEPGPVEARIWVGFQGSSLNLFLPKHDGTIMAPLTIIMENEKQYLAVVDGHTPDKCQRVCFRLEEIR